MIQVRVGHLSWTDQTVDLGLDLTGLRDGAICNSQHYCRTEDGREVCIHYDSGLLSFTDEEDAEFEGARLSIGPVNHSRISIARACELLGLTVDGKIPARPDPAEFVDLPLGPNFCYYHVQLSLTPSVLSAIVAEVGARWPEAMLSIPSWDREAGKLVQRVLPLDRLSDLSAAPSDYGGCYVWQDAKTCATWGGSGWGPVMAAQAGPLAFSMRYELWEKRVGITSDSRFTHAAEAPDDLPVALPPEGQQIFWMDMSARLDDPTSRANLEAVDAILARHLVPVTWWTHYDGRPDETRPHQTWAGRDIVDWCTKAPHHATRAQKGRAKDRERVWTWERVAA